ncbi:XrtA/PEP-CTERM system TPR-repeat protein PrsT [Kordiimonas lacus]|jgi:putative PEP-CTERM system TPR-repeat lipoprotein|uniref:XrtA/PEP-CTERM system TPR-repeat protein PrsT n=2 Tax=Kordiimonas TaxID=288021 RepID=UPI002FD9DBF2
MQPGSTVSVQLQAAGKRLREGVAAFALMAIAGTSGVVAQSGKEDVRVLIDSGDFEAAIRRIEQIQQGGQADSELYILLSRAYIQTGAGIAAEAAIERARRLGADYAQTAVLFAKTKLLQGKFSDAIGALRGVNIPSVQRADSYVVLGDANFALRKYDEAHKNYELARAADDSNFQAYLGLSRLGLQNGRLDQAADYAQKAAVLAPDNTMVRYTEGLIARYQGNIAAAEEYFLEAQKLFPGNILANIELAAMRIDQGRIEDAQTYLDAIYAAAPKHPMALYLSGTILARQGRYEEANTLLNSARVVTENYLPAIYIRGLVAYELGNLSQAEELLQKVVSARPASLPARLTLASAYLKQEQPQAALNTLRPALEARPDDPNILAIAAAATMRLGDIENGKILYEALAAKTGGEAGLNDIDLIAKLALAKFVAGQTGDALSTLAQAVQNQQANLRSLAILAGMQIREDDLDAAEKTIASMLAFAPDRGLGYNLKGSLEFKRGQYAAAARSFEAAYSRNPEYYTALRNKALSQIQLGQFGNAEKDLKRLLEVTPNDARAKAMLGRTLLRQNKPAEAVEYFSAAVRAIPNSVDVWADYSEALGGAGKTADAISQAKDTAVMAADRPDLLRRMGELLLQLGEARLAVRPLSRYVAYYPESGEAHLLQGRAMLAIKLYTGSKTAFRRASQARESKPDEGVLDWYIFAADALSERFDEAMARRSGLKPGKRPADVSAGVVGDLLLRSGRPEEAVEAYRAAMTTANSSDLYLGLARSYEQLGDKAAAIATLEGFISKTPVSRDARLMLGGLYVSQGRTGAAIKQYESILRNGVADAHVAAVLALAYMEDGNSKSVPLIERAYLIRPEDPFILDAYGWILLQATRDTSKSIPALELATRRAPAEALYRYHLGMAYLARGRRNDAEAAFEAALQLDPDFSQAADARRQLELLR